MTLHYSKAVHDHFILEEGYKHNSYTDHLGHWTIGVGHLLSKTQNFAGLVWGDAKIIEVLEADIDQTVVTAREIFPEWDIIPPTVQLGVMDMIFNLGPYGFRQFKTVIRMIHNAKYVEAGAAALESKWARQDVPNRARRTAKLLTNA